MDVTFLCAAWPFRVTLRSWLGGCHVNYGDGYSTGFGVVWREIVVDGERAVQFDS